MSEPYTLPFRLSEAELKDLNAGENTLDNFIYSPEFRFAEFMRNRNSVTELGWIDEIIKACRSGKKIVNPLSPREELEKTFKAAASYHEVSYCEGYKTGIETALQIIAKEHPDIADWIKDSDKR